MDCSTCRSFFSQSFDDRLAGSRRQEFAIHIQACASCDSEFALYRRVFSAVRGLPDEEVKPFQAPAEVPGALSVLQGTGSSSRPRFARVAAAALIMLGLAGTHVLVFQWSRDHASRENAASGEARVPAGPAIAANTPSLVSALPSGLRDHVEGLDLFVRTQEQLPDDPQASAVAAADWAVSDLPRLTQVLTDDLRMHPYEIAPEHRALMHRYIQAAREEFVPAMQALLERETPPSMSEVRSTVKRCRVLSDLREMKMMTASLPRGRAYSSPRPSAVKAVQKLAADGRKIIYVKEKRLAGEFSSAIDGVSAFQTEFPKSRFKPAAVFLQFEALNAAGRTGDALTVIISAQGIPMQGWGRVKKIIETPQCGLAWTTEHDERPLQMKYVFRLEQFPPDKFPLNPESLRRLADYYGAAVAAEVLAPESRPSRK